MNWLAAVAAVVLLVAAQEWWAEHHRRRYGLWRSTWERLFWANPDERAQMWTAFTHRDPDGSVERARLIAIVLIAISFIVLFAQLAISTRAS
jgi:hypothetical protein